MARNHVLQTGIEVLELVFDFPRSTIKDLVQAMRSQHDKQMCQRTMRRNLQCLEQLGYVAKYRTNDGCVRWRANCQIVINTRETVGYRAA